MDASSPDAARGTMRARLDPIDLARGAVMALMALDHTRTFLTDVPYPPTDLARTYPALFLTRWTSQYCTPLFLVLAGVGAGLAAQRRTSAEMARWLVTRGLAMVLLEMTAVRWGWYFNVAYAHTSPQILWAIGLSMILLAPLVWLPPRAVAAIGVSIVVLQHAVAPWLGVGADAPWLWALLYERGHAFTIARGAVFIVNFPPLPLFGLMATGYGCAAVFQQPNAERRQTLVATGLVMTLAFLVLRTFNFYGEHTPWAPQADLAHSVMSFFSLTKQPLSLLMALATVGPALIWLGVVNAERWWWRPLVVIGRVPLFFYLVHVPVIHGLAVALSWWRDGSAAWLFTSPYDRPPGFTLPEGWGFGLPAVYLWTLVVLVALYPACAWYAALKARSRSTVLSYL